MTTFWRNPKGVLVVCAILLMAGLALSSTKPSPKVEGLNQSFIDHVLDFAHFPIYFVLTWLWISALENFKRHGFRFIFAFFISAFWGVLNEWIQQFTPGRSSSLHDVITNSVGAGCAIAVVILSELLYFRKS